jgi:hypothetical protein
MDDFSGYNLKFFGPENEFLEENLEASGHKEAT